MERKRRERLGNIKVSRKCDVTGREYERLNARRAEGQGGRQVK